MPRDTDETRRWITRPLPPPDEGRGRTLARQAARDIDKLVLEVIELTEAEIHTIPISDDLRREILTARGLTSHSARRRQLRHVSGMLRASEVELDSIRKFVIEGIRVAFDPDAELRHLEALRDGLCDEERYPETLEAACAEFPHLDRMKARRLAEAMHENSDDQKSYRELFRTLRQAADAASEPFADPASDDPSG